MALVSRWTDREPPTAELVEEQKHHRLRAKQNLEDGNYLVYRKTDCRIIYNPPLKNRVLVVQSLPISKNSNCYHITQIRVTEGHYYHLRRQMYKNSRESAVYQPQHLGKFSRSKFSTTTNAKPTLSRSKSDTFLTCIGFMGEDHRNRSDTFLQNGSPPK